MRDGQGDVMYQNKHCNVAYPPEQEGSEHIANPR